MMGTTMIVAGHTNCKAEDIGEVIMLDKSARGIIARGTLWIFQGDNERQASIIFNPHIE